MIKNPRFGNHPDLFGGDTPVFVPFDQLSRDEKLSLKRLNLTTEEFNEIENTDEELYRAIIENSI